MVDANWHVIVIKGGSILYGDVKYTSSIIVLPSFGAADSPSVEVFPKRFIFVSGIISKSPFDGI